MNLIIFGDKYIEKFVNANNLYFFKKLNQIMLLDIKLDDTSLIV